MSTNLQFQMHFVTTEKKFEMRSYYSTAVDFRLQTVNREERTACDDIVGNCYDVLVRPVSLDKCLARVETPRTCHEALDLSVLPLRHNVSKKRSALPPFRAPYSMAVCP